LHSRALDSCSVHRCMSAGSPPSAPTPPASPSNSANHSPPAFPSSAASPPRATRSQRSRSRARPPTPHSSPSVQLPSETVPTHPRHHSDPKLSPDPEQASPRASKRPRIMEQNLSLVRRREGGTEEDSSPSDASSSQGKEAAANIGRSASSSKSARSSTLSTAPKIKRTRTLTTPHQSAVLHALLAQVRLWKARCSLSLFLFFSFFLSFHMSLNVTFPTPVSFSLHGYA
jgi:hypothetical protein